MQTLARSQVAGESRRGFLAIEFRCPQCGSTRWGTAGLFGYCNGSKVWQFDNGAGEWVRTLLPAHGYLLIERCAFEWLRADDWVVFRPASAADTFSSREEFERFISTTTAVVQ